MHHAATALADQLSTALPHAHSAARLPATAGMPPLPQHEQIGIPDPVSGLGSYIVGHVADAVTGLLRALSNDFLSQLAGPVARYVLSTPDLTSEATLTHYWLVSLSVLGACLGLLLAIAGTAIITGPSNRIGIAARESLGARLAGGVAAAAVSLPLVALEVDLANRIVDVFIGTGFAAGHNPLWTALTQASHGNAGSGLAVLVTVTVGVVLLVTLLIEALVRWATLWLLVVLAPLAMGLSVLPGGQSYARLWWRLQAVTVLLPIANAVLLGTYVAMFTSERDGLVGALAGVAVLALMTKLPGWALGSALQTNGREVTTRLHHAHRTIGNTAGRATTLIAPAGVARRSARQVARHVARGLLVASTAAAVLLDGRAALAAGSLRSVPRAHAWLALPLLSPTGGIGEVTAFAAKLTDYVTAVAASIAVLFIAINGLRWTTSGGNPAKQAEAKTGLTAAVVGLALAVSANLIVNLVLAALA
jgi:hypothetical protein